MQGRCTGVEAQAQSHTKVPCGTEAASIGLASQLAASYQTNKPYKVVTFPDSAHSTPPPAYQIYSQRLHPRDKRARPAPPAWLLLLPGCSSGLAARGLPIPFATNGTHRGTHSVPREYRSQSNQSPISRRLYKTLYLLLGPEIQKKWLSYHHAFINITIAHSRGTINDNTICLRRHRYPTVTQT